MAEVLDADVAGLVERAWGVRARRVYQATEGLLALDCLRGRLHLNEQGVVIEPEWLDDDRRRFVPIVTDFDRETQLVVRYRLDDVLRLPAVEEPCPCGDPARVVEAVEGRADEVIPGIGADGRVVPVFPDTIRRAMALAISAGGNWGSEDGGALAPEGPRGATGAGWGIRWSPGSLEVALERTGDDATDRALELEVHGALGALFDSVGAQRPGLRFVPWESPAPGAKAVRIRRADPAFAVPSAKEADDAH